MPSISNDIQTLEASILAIVVDLARTWATLQTFKTTTFKVVDVTTPSKTAAFSLSGASANADLTLAWTGTADRTVTFADFAGEVCILDAAQTIKNKTLNVNNEFRASTSSSGASFADNSDITKKLRVVLSGAAASTNNSITLSPTVAHNYTLPDYTASAVLVGNTTAAAGTLGVSNLTAQTGSIGATTLLTSSANSSGAFRVSFYIVNTVIGNAADTVKVGVAWNDGAAQAAEVLLTNAVVAPAAPAILHSLTTVGNASYGSLTVYAAASTAITFTTTVSLVGTPQYTCRVRIESL